MTGRLTTLDRVRWVAALHVAFRELPLFGPPPAAARAAGPSEVVF